MNEEPMRLMTLHADYYQQFDADLTQEVPGEGYGGWRRARVTLDLNHTALVVMHAWETGTPAQYPGWYRAIEYIPRSQEILANVMPALLETVRAVGMTLIHVVGGGDYYRRYAGYQRAVEMTGVSPAIPRVTPDPTWENLRLFRSQHSSVGAHNQADTDQGFAKLDFPQAARPLDNEGIAEDAQQLFALCQSSGINHLIYTGFAINWCLLMSPGGMVDMRRTGMICSTLRQAVTAVENRESARTQAHKEEALWRVALGFGFIFDVDDLVTQLAQTAIANP